MVVQVHPVVKHHQNILHQLCLNNMAINLNLVIVNHLASAIKPEDSKYVLFQLIIVVHLQSIISRFEVK